MVDNETGRTEAPSVEIGDRAADMDGKSGGARHTALLALRYGAMVFCAAVIVQFYLAGVGIFAATGPVKDAASLDPHRQLGYILAALALLVLIAAIVARPGRQVLGAAIALFVLTGIEGGLASAGPSAPYLGALHPVIAAAILGITISLIRWTRRGSRNA